MGSMGTRGSLKT